MRQQRIDRQLGIEGTDDSARTPGKDRADSATAQRNQPMNILIITVGSRGDVQPFVALGKQIRDEDGTASAIAAIEEIAPRDANH